MCRAKAGDNFLKTVSFTHPDSIDESRARLCLSTLIHLFDLLVSAQIKDGALSGRPREKMKKMNFLLEIGHQDGAIADFIFQRFNPLRRLRVR